MTANRLLGWLQAAHPFPVVAVVSLTALVGLVSARGTPDLDSLILALVAMLASQLAIGWTNDYVDRDKDAVFQPAKPVPSGRIDARLLPTASLVAVGLSVWCGALLGLVPTLLLATGTAAGLAYNAGVKDTRFSWLPYVGAFAVLPPYVWSALDVFRDEYLLLYLVGAPLAVAAHLANVLPDLDSDTTAGRPGLAVALGRSSALRLLGSLVIAPPAVIAATLPWVEYEAAVLTGTLAVYVVLLALAGAAYRRRPFREGAVWGFRCIAVAGIVLATGWLAAVG